MTYTVRYAHLELLPNLKIGDHIYYGDYIGVMGSTGQSTGQHLHIDVVEGTPTRIFLLSEMYAGNPKPEIKQLNYFIDDALFKSPLIITTYYGDPVYMSRFGKIHLGYDVVPRDKTKKQIYWNRNIYGVVTAKYENDPGYGNMIYIAFEAK